MCSKPAKECCIPLKFSCLAMLNKSLYTFDLGSAFILLYSGVFISCPWVRYQIRIYLCVLPFCLTGSPLGTPEPLVLLTPPRCLTANRTQQSVLLTWLPPANHSSPIDRYIMEFRLGEKWEVFDDSISSTDTEFKARDLVQVRPNTVFILIYSRWFRIGFPFYWFKHHFMMGEKLPHPIRINWLYCIWNGVVW